LRSSLLLGGEKPTLRAPARASPAGRHPAIPKARLPNTSAAPHAPGCLEGGDRCLADPWLL